MDNSMIQLIRESLLAALDIEGIGPSIGVNERIDAAVAVVPEIYEYIRYEKNFDYLFEHTSERGCFDNALLSSPLHIECENGNLENVKHYLKTGIPINLRAGREEFTPLHVAVHMNHLEIVKYLVKKGANVNIKDSRGISPLSNAARQGYYDIVVTLVNAGADLKTTTNCMNTPLHLASLNGHFNIVSFLMKKGMDVNANNIDKWRPIHFASYTNTNCEIIKELVVNGADYGSGADIKGKNNVVTPLILATCRRQPHVVEYLLSIGADVNAKSSLKITPLHLSCESGDINIVNILLKHGANVNAKDFENLTPLHLASARNHPKVVAALLRSRNICVDAKSNINMTPLHYAAQHGFINIVEQLIQNNADINAVAYEGFTPLHMALQHKRLEVSKYLINKGADIYAEDDQNWTPLHNAVYNGFSLDIVKDLVNKGSNINAKIDNGKTVLHHAAEYNHLSIFKFLINKGADIKSVDRNSWTPLHSACYDGNTEIAKLLIQGKADINAKTVKKTTPLHFAVTNGHYSTTELLLESGADVNLTDHTNWSAMFFAVHQGRVPCITLLLKYGADLNIKDTQDNKTALHCAAGGRKTLILKLLVSMGANINEVMKNGCTPLHQCAVIGDFESVQILLERGAYYDATLKVRGQRISETALTLAEKGFHFKVAGLLKLIHFMFRAVKLNDVINLEKYVISGAMVNARSCRYNRPIILASWRGYFDIVQLLVKYKADVNIKGDNSCTALHYAVKYKHTHIVHYLLQHGAVYNSTATKESKVPLDFAERDSEIFALLQSIERLFTQAVNGDTENVKRELVAVKNDNLESYNSIVNTRNNDGKTLLGLLNEQ